MLKIVDASNRRAVRALLTSGRIDDAATVRRVSAIVEKVRTGGDRVLSQYAHQFDSLEGAIEVSPDEMREAAAQVPRDVRGAPRRAPRRRAAAGGKQGAPG